MKKFIVLLTVLFYAGSAWSQAPDSFTYQAVVRDAGGNVLINQTVGVQISILQGVLPGTTMYIETFALTTNGFGLVNLAVGSGSVQSGDIATIDWSSGPFYLNVGIDITGGTSYTDMGTVQLLSVPFALHAKTAENGFSGNYSDLNGAPDFSAWDQDVSDDFTGDYSDLINKPDFTGWDQDISNDFSGNYNDLSNKPVLTGDANGQLDANTVTAIQGNDISVNLPADGQVLKWNSINQQWEPADDELGAAGTTDGVVTSAGFTGSTTKTLTLIRSNGLGDITAVFTDLVDDADASPTNELQTLSISGSDLSISNGNTVTIPNNTYYQGSGIEIDASFQINNTMPDQTVTMNNGTGINVTGSYPDFTITNTQPDQAVTLTGNGATTVSGTYPNYTISSTDNNTTYTAGTGLALFANQFFHSSHSGDVIGATALTVTGIQGRQVSSNLPANGQVLKWNTTNNRWELADDELGAAGTNDGVVTSIGVAGTTTKTITLTRSQSLPDLTATFTDEGSVYTAGTGIDITGSVVTNTSPDQTVTLTQGGATTITGTYPNFTISSTDNNTTYSAGTGLTMTGTTFSHDAHSGDVTGTTSITVTGLRGRTISSTTPTGGQILKYNGTNWAPASDDNTTYTAGTGLSLTGTQFANTAPDLAVTLTGGGATTITGSYPNFTITSTDNNSGGTITSIATNNGITGGPITTSGTIELTGQALALHNLGTNGFIVRTGAGTVSARTMTGASGINISNGNGVTGNPTISPVFGTTTGTIAEGSHMHTAYGAAGTNGMVQFNDNGNFGASANLFWDNTNTRLGVGTNAPSGMMSVKQTTTTPATEPLFEVRDKDGLQVFAVYEDSVMIYVSDDAAKTNKGAFAVSGRNTAKTVTNEYLRVSPDSVRVFIDEDFTATGGTRGGFAIGGFSAAKTFDDNFFNIEAGVNPEIIDPSEPRILWYPVKEAVMAGRVLVQHVDSVGLNSWASGFESRSIGNYSQALGYRARAKGNNSTAIGHYANAASNNSYAIGDSALAMGVGSYAIGSVGRDTTGQPTGIQTRAFGNYSFSIGLGTRTDSTNAFAFGNNTWARGVSSTAFGYESVASGRYSIAGGFRCGTFGRSAIALGEETYAGKNAVALGIYQYAPDENAIAIGQYNFAESPGAVAIGYANDLQGSTYAFGDYNQSVAGIWGAYAVGSSNLTFNSHTLALGNYNEVHNDYSVALGNNLVSSGVSSVAIGANNTASGNYSTSIGFGITTSGQYSIGIALSNQSSTTLAQNNAMAIMGGNVGIDNIVPFYKLDVVGDIRATGAVYANANGTMYFKGGDDSEIWDVNSPNTLAICGVWDPTIATLRLGTGTGGINEISGSGGNIGIATSTPQVNLDVNGGIALRQTTNAALTAATHNYNIGTGSYFRISSTGAYNLTGISGGKNGKIIIMTNVGSFTITLIHQGALSLAANRFYLSTAASVALDPNHSITLIYDSASGCWRDIALR